MAIIISKKGEKSKKLQPSKFKDEGYLQKYILDNPESIPLYEIKEDLQLLIIAREFPTQTGPIDAVGVDQEGNLYFIETKLYKNPDKRLVVAQILDYGAAISSSYQIGQDFINQASKETEKIYDISLEEKLKEFFNLNEADKDNLLENIELNVSRNNFYFIVLMDKLHDRLRDLIVFLNENSNFSIFAVELEYYEDENQEIVIPKIFGTEVRKESRAGSGNRKKWTEEKFFEAMLGGVAEECHLAIKDMYEFSKANAVINWGTGTQLGSFNAAFHDICPRSIYSIWTNGKLSVNFLWLNGDETIERFRDDLKERLENNLGLKVPQNYTKKGVNYEPQEWVPKLEEMKRIIIELLARHRR